MNINLTQQELFCFERIEFYFIKLQKKTMNSAETSRRNTPKDKKIIFKVSKISQMTYKESGIVDGKTLH